MKIAEVKTIQDVLGIAFRIPYNRFIKIVFPSGKKNMIQIAEAPALERCYDVQNGIMVIRCIDAVYVIPFTEAIEQIVINRGFMKKGMYVPFSNGEVPTTRKEEFDRLFNV